MGPGPAGRAQPRCCPPGPARGCRGDGDGATLGPFTLCFMDCDGVIFDSNKLKTDAYRQTLRDLGVDDAGVEAFVKLHLADVSVSRYVKFRTFFAEIWTEKPGGGPRRSWTPPSTATARTAASCTAR